MSKKKCDNKVDELFLGVIIKTKLPIFWRLCKIVQQQKLETLLLYIDLFILNSIERESS